MSTSIYLTAEIKTGDKWSLFKPCQEHQDFEGKLTPPLIVDGGWPRLANKIIEKNKNFGAPSDVSQAFHDFRINVLQNNWSLGWGMYAELKNIVIESGVNDQVKLSALFKSISVNKNNLRLIYWWG